MRLLILTSYLFLTISYCFSQEDRDTSIQKLYLKNKVKSVTIWNYFLKSPYSDQKKSHKLLTSYFDIKANEIKRITYDERLTGKEIEWEEFFFYDHTSKLLEHIYGNLKNNSSWRAIFYYDDNGNLIDKKNYKDNKPEYRFTMSYDSLQRKTLMLGYSIYFDKAETKMTYEYDLIGHCLSETTIKFDTTLIDKWNYRYNTKGQLIEEFAPNDTNYRFKRKYEYNNKGQLTKMINYDTSLLTDENGNEHLETKETNRYEYIYDTNGLLIQKKEFYDGKYTGGQKYFYTFFK